MTPHSAYVICRDYNKEFGKGTAAQIAIRIGLIHRTGFASQLSLLFKEYHYLLRDSAHDGTNGFCYYVKMIPGKGKNKNKMFIDPNTPAEKWIATTDSKKIQDVNYWNAYVPRTINRLPKNSPQSHFDTSLNSDMSDADLQAIHQVNLITKRSAQNRVELKECIKQMIQIGITTLLKQNETLVLIYSAKKQISIKYLPYDEESYVIKKFDDILKEDKPTHEEKE